MLLTLLMITVNAAAPPRAENTPVVQPTGRRAAQTAPAAPAHTAPVSGEAAGPPSTAPAKPMVIQPERIDFAVSMIRLDRYMTLQRPDEQHFAAMNKAFDHASSLYMSHAYPASLHAVNDTFVLLQDEPASATLQKFANSIRVRLSPVVLRLDKHETVKAELRTMYGVEGGPEAPLPFVMRVVDSGGIAVNEQPFALEPGRASVVIQTVGLELPIDALKPGAHWIELQPPAGPSFPAARLHVVAHSLNDARSENLKRLDALGEVEQPLAQALLAVRMRNELLSDFPPPEYTTTVLLDLERLSREISANIEMLAQKKNPFYRRAGDTWRTVRHEGRDHRFRVYAPQAACTDSPVPLVIALHGLQGGECDENTFFDGYGGGLLKKLADQHAFIAVAPHTNTLAIQASNVEGLIDELATCYSIDPQRVYLIGHALGAQVANNWAMAAAHRLAAVCTIAGGGKFTGAKTIALTLVVAGELDTIAAPSRLETACNEAIAAGLPVAFRSYSNCGHTFVITEALPDVVEWLLKVRLAKKP